MIEVLYNTTKARARTRNRGVTHIKDKDGKLPKTEKEIAARWIEYFEEIFAKEEISEEI